MQMSKGGSLEVKLDRGGQWENCVITISRVFAADHKRITLKSKYPRPPGHRHMKRLESNISI